MITYLPTGETWPNRKEAKKALGGVAYMMAAKHGQIDIHGIRGDKKKDNNLNNKQYEKGRSAEGYQEEKES